MVLKWKCLLFFFLLLLLEVKYLETLEKFICKRNLNGRFCATLESAFLDPGLSVAWS